MTREVYALLAMFVCGGAVVMLFDMFRAARSCVKTNVFFPAMQDAAFWTVSAWFLAKGLWIFSDGRLRLYEVIGFLIGALLYILLFQRAFLKVFMVFFENFFKIIHLILKILLTPPVFLYKMLLVPLYTKAKSLFGKKTG